MQAINKYLVIIIGLLCLSLGKAQCPFGNGNRVDCQYGCGNYVDENNDSYCDHSSLSSASKADETNAGDNEVPDTDEEFESPVVIYETIPAPKSVKANDIEENQEILLTAEDEIEEDGENTPETKPESKASQSKKYHFWLITFLTLGLYVFTFVLMQAGILPKVYHRRIWNAMLLIAGLISCILGFLMVIHINYPFLGAKYLSFLKWHVEAGIAMTIIMLFHIAWHWQYYKNIFKKIKTKE